MRLSISLPPYLYGVIRSLARDRDATFNATLRDLLRTALQPPHPPQPAPPGELPVVHGRRPISSDDVYALERDSP